MDEIARVPAYGGNIKSWGFRVLDFATEDPAEVLGTLDIEFASEALYRYYDVPRHVFIALTNSHVVGSDFHTLIKQGGYRYEKLKDGKPTPKVRK